MVDFTAAAAAGATLIPNYSPGRPDRGRSPPGPLLMVTLVAMVLLLLWLPLRVLVPKQGGDPHCVCVLHFNDFVMIEKQTHPQSVIDNAALHLRGNKL